MLAQQFAGRGDGAGHVSEGSARGGRGRTVTAWTLLIWWSMIVPLASVSPGT